MQTSWTRCPNISSGTERFRFNSRVRKSGESIESAIDNRPPGNIGRICGAIRVAEQNTAVVWHAVCNKKGTLIIPHNNVIIRDYKLAYYPGL